MSDLTLESQIQEMIATGRFSPEQGEQMRQYANKRQATAPSSEDMAAFARGGAPVGDLYKEARAGAGAADPLAKPGLMGGGDIMAGPELQGYFDPVEDKAKTRARNQMEKRRLQEEMTGEPQPGLSYEETLTQERIKVERELQEGIQKRASQGMTIGDVLSGQAPPKVGGEFVFPPGDVTKSPAYQEAKAAADAATEGQVVAEIPDDEQLGGKEPRDTEPVNEPDKEGAGFDRVEKPGDFRRNAAQRKLGQLHSLRSIAEGGMRIGNIPVTGDFMAGGPPRPHVTGQPQQAEGIRSEISRISGEEDLYLKSQLQREEQRALSGLRSKEEEFKFKLENMGVSALNLTGRQAKELWIDSDKWVRGDTVKKANKALAAVRAGLESLREGPGGEAPLGQAQVLAARQVLQAYGEGSRMSDQDINQILLSPQFAGMYDRAYRFLTGRATPATVNLYKDMLNRLDKATKAHFVDIRDRRAQRFTDFWGAPKSEVLKAYGTIFEEGDMPKAAPKGNQIRMTKDGVEEWKLEKDEEAWRRRGWTRAP